MILSVSSALSLSSAIESILLSSSEGGECEGGELEDTEDGESMEAGSEARDAGGSAENREE